MFTLPETYTEGMEEVVKWANNLDADMSKRFMLDVYKIYMDWKYILETLEEDDGDNTGE